MHKLFVVSDVVVSPGKGLVLLPGLRETPRGLGVGCKVELIRPDGKRRAVKVVALDVVGGAMRLCVPFKPPVGPGTEVWFAATAVVGARTTRRRRRSIRASA